MVSLRMSLWVSMMVMLLLLLDSVRVMLEAHVSKGQSWVGHRHHRGSSSHCIQRVASHAHRGRHSGVISIRRGLRDGEQHIEMASVRVWSNKMVSHAGCFTGPGDGRAKVGTQLARMQGRGDRAEVSNGIFQHLALLLEELILLLEVLKG